MLRCFGGSENGTHDMMHESMDGQKNLPRWSETVFSVLKNVEFGSVSFTLPDGRSFLARGSKPGPEGHFNVVDDRLFTRVVRDGDLGFPEAYMDGWWDTPDLQSLMDVILANNEAIAHNFTGAALLRFYERVRHWWRANTKRGSRKNISYHYDLGNDFYSLWLDPTMTYSSALYSGQGETLEQAQQNKYASICDRMGLQRDDHVLEIGCGWGGFAEYAIRERGARVTGLTLSQEQHDYAQKRLFEAGLADRAEIVMRDYRDERGKYDGIASIEMFEAVGEKYWPTYFKTVFERLKPGKAASIQMITIAENLWDRYRQTTDFIQKYIFPGGMLAAPSAARRAAENAGLIYSGSMEFGESYSKTLRLWYDDFNARWGEITTLGFDERFRRMWNFYLAGCAATFQSGTTDVTQMTLRKPV